MDFFTHQDRARRKSGLLVFLFALGVIGIALTVFIAVSGAQSYAEGRFVLDWRVFLITVGGVSLVIFLGSSFKVLMLRSGGSVVADSLGGRLIDRHTTDLYERRLLNVVDEMALASGTPVPAVYLLDKEEAINAFAAGYAPGDAVIGVTRGCMEKLSRDELQGVVAHEFSHIINGDMRLNVRLIGIVFGILALGLLGRIILRSALYRRSFRSSSSDKNNPLPQLALGLILLIVGYVGTFFGSLIKAAVSRQREFLADASAVRFTRNPAGIGGALRKIGGLARGSVMDAAGASEVSHMLFGDGFERNFSSLLATHPPLRERILRIDPSFKAFAPVPESFHAPIETEPVAGFEGAVAGFHGAAEATAPAEPAPTAPAGETALSQIGQPADAHVRYARELIASLPAAVVDAAHDPYSARALLYALLIDPEEAPRKRQLERLEKFAEAPVYKEGLRLLASVDGIDRRARIPLIDLALPSLRQLSPRQYTGFKENLRSLIEADDHVDLFERLLLGTVLHHLEPQYAKARRVGVRHRSLKHLGPDCSCLLSALADAGHEDVEEARRAFTAGAALIDAPGLELLPPERCGLQRLDKALEVIGTATAACKQNVLRACAATIAWDREVSLEEGEMFRIVSVTNDCPSPPLLPGQRLA